MLAEVVKPLGVSVFHPGPLAKARVSRGRTENEVSRAQPEQVAREVEELIIENTHLRKTVLVERGRAIEAVDEARKELARGLHDGPTQLVSAIVMHLDYCKLLLEKDPSKLTEEIIAAQELAKQAMYEMRTLLFELRPLALEAQGLEAALQLLLERRQKEVAEGPKLILKTKSAHPNGAISRQDHKVEAAIFAIVQEAVNNALKYAQADNVIVQLEETPTGLRTIIADDGKGFAVDEIVSDYGQRCSLGIVNIQERAELIDSKLTLESAPGQGTCITVDVSKAEEGRMKKRKCEPASE
jgi:signal transduction histidine kinase